MPKRQKSGVKFDPIPPYAAENRCIYSNGDDEVHGPPFSDEHIIPLCFGGVIILPKASCEKCSRITSELEGKIAKGSLNPIRQLLNLPSRKKASDRPKQINLYCCNGDENDVRKIDLQDYPGVLTLPQYPGPGIADFGNRQLEQKPPWCYAIPSDLEKIRKKYGIESFSTPALQAGSFSRILAKIAHAYAIAENKDQPFVSFLPPYVLEDKKNELMFLIGSFEANEPPTAQDQIHQIRMVTEIANETRFICCHIRLFASFGSPAYRVVVGQYMVDHDPNKIFKAQIFDERSAGDFRLDIRTDGSQETGWDTITMDPLDLFKC